MMSAFAASALAFASAERIGLVVVVDRIADAVVLEAEHLDAGLPGAVLGRLERIVGRDVDALQHRGQDLAGEEAVLVGVDADAELAGVGGGLQHALAGRAGGRVDDVGAAIDLRLGEFAALDRVVPGRRRRAGHVGDHLVLAVGGVFDALRVAALEGRDQRNVHAADEADLAGLRRLGRDHADQERSFLGLEHHRLHVRLVDHHVDDAEFGVREFVGDLVERGRPGEARHDDRRVAVLGELAQDLLALRLVLDFEIAEVDAGVLLELARAVEDALVEGLVELAAEVIDDRRLDVGGPGRRGGGQAAAEKRGGQRRGLRANISLPPAWPAAPDWGRFIQKPIDGQDNSTGDASVNVRP